MVLLPVVAKYTCGLLVLQRVFVAVVAKVANLIRDYLVINRRWLRWLQGSKVLAAVIANVRIWKISCTKGGVCSGYESRQLSMRLFNN